MKGLSELFPTVPPDLVLQERERKTSQTNTSKDLIDLVVALVALTDHPDIRAGQTVAKIPGHVQIQKTVEGGKGACSTELASFATDKTENGFD